MSRGPHKALTPRAAAIITELARAEGRYLSIHTLADAAGYPESDSVEHYPNNTHNKAAAKAARIIGRLAHRYPGAIEARRGKGGYRLRPGALRKAPPC